MFRIVQPLNNNVAVVKNKSGEQAVVMGLGIIFKKKKGDLLAEERVEKVFQLKRKLFCFVKRCSLGLYHD